MTGLAEKHTLWVEATEEIMPTCEEIEEAVRELLQKKAAKARETGFDGHIYSQVNISSCKKFL